MEETINLAFDLRQNFVDSNGLVCQRNKEGGDSAYRTALTAILLKLLGLEQEAFRYMVALTKHVYLGKGIFRRHPGTSLEYPPPENQKVWWYEDPNNFSRDNAAKTVLAFCIFKQTWVVIAWVKAMLKRKLFHQNIKYNYGERPNETKIPDIISLGEISNLIRCSNIWVLYPVLLLFDIKFLGDLYFRNRQKWDYDSLIAIDLVIAKIILPTPFSLLAIYLYKKTDYKKRILYYYSETENDIKPLGLMYIKVCEAYL